MERWFTYLKERFSLSLIFVVIGISLSGLLIHNGNFAFFPFLFSSFGLFLFFILLRLMDDVKDYQKDRIAFPQRPLSRGLIQREEAIKAVDFLQILLFAFSLIVWIIFNSPAGLAYALMAGCLWLLFKEFYAEKWLAQRPVLLGVSHLLVFFSNGYFLRCG